MNSGIALGLVLTWCGDGSEGRVPLWWGGIRLGAGAAGNLVRDTEVGLWWEHSEWNWSLGTALREWGPDTHTHTHPAHTYLLTPAYCTEGAGSHRPINWNHPPLAP